MTDLTAQTLLNIGFVDAAIWTANGDTITYRIHPTKEDAVRVMFSTLNALYAFVHDDEVLYIGKTARSVRRRFVTYCRPGIRQSTNIRCNGNIKEAHAENREIRIFVFTPISHLQYGEFEINLAAGLEDALIQQFTPPWNGRVRGKPVTEEAEREKAEEWGDAPRPENDEDTVAPVPHRAVALCDFTIRLGEAYFHKGIINPGVVASQYLGGHGDPVEVLFSDGSESVFSSINRTANASGAARIVGRNLEIARWFQKRFRRGDTVSARVLDRHRILLDAP